MAKNSQKKTPEQMVEAIFALDLDPIKLKLMDKREGHGWTIEQADHNELEYKRFLALLATYPDQSIAPSTEVDKFWHGHILDTMKYAEDCENVFGYFLHHFPYFGMRGEEDAANLVSAFMNMQRLHDREFGNAQQATSRNAAWCGVVAGEAVQQAEQTAAWCGAVSEQVTASAEQESAWCGAVSGNAVHAEDQKAAWCGAASGNASVAENQDAAWCGATAGMPSPESSAESIAWCGAAGHGIKSSLYLDRPTLVRKLKSA